MSFGISSGFQSIFTLPIRFILPKPIIHHHIVQILKHFFRIYIIRNKPLIILVIIVTKLKFPTILNLFSICFR